LRTVILDFNRASHRRHRTGKFCEHAITRRFDEAAVVSRQVGLDTSRLIRPILA